MCIKHKINSSARDMTSVTKITEDIQYKGTKEWALHNHKFSTLTTTKNHPNYKINAIILSLAKVN